MRVDLQRGIMLALWALTLVRLVADHPLLVYLSLAGLTAYLILALPASGWINRLVLLLSGGLSLVLCHVEANWRPLYEGLEFALIFTAFLPTLMLTRASLEVGPEVERSRRVFAGSSASDRQQALLIGSTVLGSVLTLGVLPMLAPLLDPDAPDRERRRVAQTLLRGLALGIAWSPFTVGMAVTLAFYPALTLWQIVVPGLVLSIAGIGIAIFLDDRRANLRAIGRAMRGFQPLLLPLGGAMAAVVGLASISPLGTIQTIVVVMPVLAWLWIVRSNRRAVHHVARRTYSGLDRLGGELMLFTGAVALGRVLQESAVLHRLLEQPLIAGLDSAAVLAVAIAFGIVFALCGLHSVILGTCVGVMLSPFHDRVADFVGAQLVLFAWSCGAMLSLSALSTVVAASLFRVPIARLVYGRNVVFALLYGLLAGLLLELANALANVIAAG